MIGRQDRWQEDLFVAGPLSSHSVRMEPFYKQHGAVDDKCGVIVDVDVTTGEKSDRRVSKEIWRSKGGISQVNPCKNLKFLQYRTCG